MRKNVAGQMISVQMVDTDGVAFTSNVTCYVDVDDGGQALGQGTSPSGSCEHKGNGSHKYFPTQAETNGDHIAFTFTGSGALPVTINVYPRTMTASEEAKLQRGVQALVTGTVQSGASSTSIPTDLTETTPEHFNGRTITFTSGALAGQATDITDYAANGVLTVTALTEAPEPGTEFVIS